MPLPLIAAGLGGLGLGGLLGFNVSDGFKRLFDLLALIAALAVVYFVGFK